MKSIEKAQIAVNGRSKAGRFTGCLFVLSFVLCSLVFWLSGCGYVVRTARFVDDVFKDVLMLGSKEEFAQLGETEAEGRRRHLRNERLDRQQLMADIDRVLLTDQPSKLTDKRIR